MKKNNEKIIPKKNYIYSGIIIIVVVLIIMYIFSWHNIKKEEKLMNSYLISSKTVESKIDNFNDLKEILTEAPSSYFVLISYTGNDEIYKVEKSLKRIIDKYKINEIFYYFDYTNYLNKHESIDELNNVFKTKDIKMIPTIIYVSDGKVKNIIDNLSADNFKNLLDENSYETVK